MTHIFGVTGMPLSGKTTVAEMMEDEGFAVLDMGDIVRIEMEKRGLSVDQTGEFVNSMRDEHGMDAIAQLSVPYLREVRDERDKIVITGMRGWREKERFEAETGEKIEVVAVWASRKERRQRKQERNRDEDIEGQEFRERDLREIDNGVGKLMALSDHMVKNSERNLDSLRKEVENIVS